MSRATVLAMAVLAIGAVPATSLVISAANSETGEMRVIDGDTLAIGRERIRLNGIDAPEMPGHCRRGRVCVGGDPVASRASLEGFLAGGGAIVVHRLKRDRYGRTIAQVLMGGVDASWWQVAHGGAVYVPRWDEGRIMEGIGR